MSLSPPRVPPLLTRATTVAVTIAPPSHIQNPANARRGKTIERAPTCKRHERHAHGHGERKQHREHESDTLRIEQLGNDLDVERGVGPVESFDPRSGC